MTIPRQNLPPGVNEPVGMNEQFNTSGDGVSSGSEPVPEPLVLIVSRRQVETGNVVDPMTAMALLMKKAIPGQRIQLQIDGYQHDSRELLKIIDYFVKIFNKDYPVPAIHFKNLNADEFANVQRLENDLARARAQCSTIESELDAVRAVWLDKPIFATKVQEPRLHQASAANEGSV